MTNQAARPGALRYLAIALGLVILQTGILGWMIESRASVLRSGTEILLKTAPIDPRDLFRGDYVILSYDVSAIPAALVTGQRPAESGWQTMQVRLKPGTDGFWTVAEASFGELAPAEGSVVLTTQRFRYYAMPDAADNGELRVDYGIERYYVPEGEGHDIEMARNEGALTVAVRVGSNGKAQIRELRMDGKALYAEPLY